MAWNPRPHEAEGQSPLYEYTPYSEYPAYPPPPYGYQPTPPPGPGPLPLGEALKQLPQQYWRVLTKPAASTFAWEMGKAKWDMVLVQLLGYAILAGLLGFLRVFLVPIRLTPTGGAPAINTTSIETALNFYAGLGEIIFVPLLFFITQGIFFGLAQAFGGQGTFLAQAYLALLYQVPLGIMSGILALVPIVGGLATIATSIYEIVLAIFSIMAVHRLSGGKASAVVLTPAGILILLACCVLVLLVIAATAQNSIPR